MVRLYCLYGRFTAQLGSASASAITRADGADLWRTNAYLGVNHTLTNAAQSNWCSRGRAGNIHSDFSSVPDCLLKIFNEIPSAL